MDIQRIKDAVQSPIPAPLHQKLRDAIHEQIMDGTLKPGETLPSERAMKDHFELSRSTVRQAVNTLIQDGFLQSVAGTGTFVLEPTQKATVTGLLGLMTSSPNFNFFYPQLTAAFNQRVRESGYGLMMALHNEQAEILDEMIDEMLAQNVVGLAITPPRYGDLRPIVEKLRRNNIPTVFVGRNVSKSPFDVVTTNNENIGYEATQHLIKLGHKHIAYVGLIDYSTGSDRMRGYQRAMTEANLPPHIVQLNEPQTHPDDGIAGVPREHLAGPAQDAVYQLWNTKNGLPTPTAVFCFNDIVAMGMYKGLRDLKLVIPNDVSLVSVDNLLTIRHFEVPLTTFALPGEAIGAHSAERLLKRINGNKSAADALYLPATFVLRSSTSSP